MARTHLPYRGSLALMLIVVTLLGGCELSHSQAAGGNQKVQNIPDGFDCDLGGGTYGVCKKWGIGAIPDGYVIIGQDYCAKCKDDPQQIDPDNVWKCQKPNEAGQDICRESPIPNGFIIIAEKEVIGCPPKPTEHTNGFTIKKATADVEVACKCSPTPSTYDRGSSPKDDAYLFGCYPRNPVNNPNAIKIYKKKPTNP